MENETLVQPTVETSAPTKIGFFKRKRVRYILIGLGTAIITTAVIEYFYQAEQHQEQNRKQNRKQNYNPYLTKEYKEAEKRCKKLGLEVNISGFYCYDPVKRKEAWDKAYDENCPEWRNADFKGCPGGWHIDPF